MRLYRMNASDIIRENQREQPNAAVAVQQMIRRRKVRRRPRLAHEDGCLCRVDLKERSRRDAVGLVQHALEDEVRASGYAAMSAGHPENDNPRQAGYLTVHRTGK